MPKKSKIRAADEAATVEGDAPGGASRDDFDRIAREAAMLDDRELTSPPIDADDALRIAEEGLAGVFASEPVALSDLPRERLDEVRELPAIGRVLVQACAEVERLSDDARRAGRLLDQARKVRKRLAKLATKREVVEPGRLDELVAAEGAAPLAAALGELAAALEGGEKKEARKKKLAAARELAASLARTAVGSDGARDPEAELVDAKRTRDRVWALLERRYDLLWRIGAYAYGPVVDVRLPALVSKRRKKRLARA